MVFLTSDPRAIWDCALWKVMFRSHANNGLPSPGIRFEEIIFRPLELSSCASVISLTRTVLTRRWSQCWMKARPTAIGLVRAPSANDSKARTVAARMTTGSPSLAWCETYAHMALNDSQPLIFMNGTGRVEMLLLIL